VRGAVHSAVCSAPLMSDQATNSRLYRNQPRASIRRTLNCVNSPAFLAFQKLVFECRAYNPLETVRIAARASVLVGGNHGDDISTKEPRGSVQPRGRLIAGLPAEMRARSEEPCMRRSPVAGMPDTTEIVTGIHLYPGPGAGGTQAGSTYTGAGACASQTVDQQVLRPQSAPCANVPPGEAEFSQCVIHEQQTWAMSS